MKACIRTESHIGVQVSFSPATMSVGTSTFARWSLASCAAALASMRTKSPGSTAATSSRYGHRSSLRTSRRFVSRVEPIW